MHPLRLYLTNVRETIGDFSARVGVSRQTLYRIMSGSQAPKPALARRIVEATGGAVTLETLYHQSPQLDSVGSPPHMAAPLNAERLRVSLAIVIDHLSPKNAPELPEEVIDLASAAVNNTYIALAPVTTREGPDRLRQALKPVLEELLRSRSSTGAPHSALEKGAACAAQLYY